MKKYLYVDCESLPDYFLKVLETKKLLESGKMKNVTDAARLNGISRSTYYKYKDYVFDAVQLPQGRKAVFVLSLSHETGVLSKLLSEFSSMGANILTISQSLPVGEEASVMLTADITDVVLSDEEMLEKMRSLKGIKRIELIAIG